MTRHFLDIDDLDAAELAAVLALGARTGASSRPLEGKGAALVFEKPSARTRNSTEMAVVDLGGHPVYIRPEEVGIDTRESAEDVARTLACFHGVITARVFDHQVLQRMAGAVDVPIVNLLSDQSHPLQAVADLLTIEAEFGDTSGRSICWVGDYSNVARSLGRAAALRGASLRFACPRGYDPSPAELERFTALGAPSVEVAADPAAMVGGADVVATDAWYSMGQEGEAAARRAIFEPYRVDADLMSLAAEGSIFLHCLPAHRGDEVTDEVLDGPRSRVWAEAANRRPAARAVIEWALTSTDGPG